MQTKPRSERFCFLTHSKTREVVGDKTIGCNKLRHFQAIQAYEKFTPPGSGYFKKLPPKEYCKGAQYRKTLAVNNPTVFDSVVRQVNWTNFSRGYGSL